MCSLCNLSLCFPAGSAAGARARSALACAALQAVPEGSNATHVMLCAPVQARETMILGAILPPAFCRL